MILKTNYSDYWMPFVNRTGSTLRLDVNGGPTKREQFAILERKFNVPPHGLVHKVWKKACWEDGKPVEDIVIYTDETKHCGEGKDLIINSHISPGHGLPIWAYSKYCSAYLPCKYSIRKLQIGREVFYIEYKSDDEWRSNVGDVECKVIGTDTADPDFKDILPFYAIDFVYGQEEYAIDLNVAPGIRGSGVEKYLTGREVADILEREMEKCNETNLL